jgi:DNA-binding transcriptional LysR family regulator
MPDFLARDAIKIGSLRTILDDYLIDPGRFSIVWSSNRHVSTRLRTFADFLCERLFVRATDHTSPITG